MSATATATATAPTPALATNAPAHPNVSTSPSPDSTLLSDLTQSFLSSLRTVAATYQHRILSSGQSITPQQMMEAAQLAVARMMETTYAEVTDLPHLLSTNHLPVDPHRKKIRCYIDGCFDIMHSGHYNAIRQAKALCDVLVVGVHSDAEILKHKGPPVMNEHERMATVEACKWADEVVFDTPYDPTLELLDRLNCDFCVHGDDMPSTADGKEAYADVKAAGRMKIIKRTEGVSTTDLVGRLLLMTKEHHIKSPELVSISPAISPSRAGVASSHVLPHLQLESSVMSNKSASPIITTPTPTQPIEQHYAAGISNFLPTTWRITQFSNNCTPNIDDRVVYIDGAFDLFHIGHIETLKKAKALGTYLYVGVHDDTTVNRYKGRNYPIMNLHERVMNVLSCKYVDEVIIGAPWTITKDMITSLNIHVVASGSNTKMDLDIHGDSDDPYAAAKQAGIYTVIDISHTLQTEDVVTRIIDNRLKYENRNANRSKKELTYLTNKVHVAEV